MLLKENSKESHIAHPSCYQVCFLEHTKHAHEVTLLHVQRLIQWSLAQMCGWSYKEGDEGDSVTRTLMGGGYTIVGKRNQFF